MFAEDVYYCWSCDAHCRAIPVAATGPCCPRCHEELDEDCRLTTGPRLLSLFAARESTFEPQEVAALQSPGLWPSRAAAMH